VFLSASHDDNADLSAELELANVSGVLSRPLFSGICPGTDGIVTTLDDDAGAAIGSTCPPLGGRYTTNPGGSLNAFDGVDPNGTWRLKLTDNAAGNQGEFHNWTLELHTAR